MGGGGHMRCFAASACKGVGEGTGVLGCDCVFRWDMYIVLMVVKGLVWEILICANL